MCDGSFYVSVQLGDGASCFVKQLLSKYFLDVINI